MATIPGTTDTTLTRAIAIAERAHAAQTDKLDAPYIHHVQRVIDRVADLAPNEIATTCQTAAALHDLIVGIVSGCVLSAIFWGLDRLRARRAG